MMSSPAISTFFVTGCLQLLPLEFPHSDLCTISRKTRNRQVLGGRCGASNVLLKMNVHTAPRKVCCSSHTSWVCFLNVPTVYLDPVSQGDTNWPACTLVDGIPDIENITEALHNGPYGKCVYESANDVCDHQVSIVMYSPGCLGSTDFIPKVVNIEFSSGATASFTMVAYTSLICERQTRLHFTHGEIVGDMNTFTVTDFRTGKQTIHCPSNEGGGHGGGDLGLMRTFIDAVRSGDQTILDVDVSEIFASHLTVFAAEQSRKEGKVVDCAQYERTVRTELDQ